jgi:glutamate/tyrosine decarboxylase-like PLP-dependent enzyme
LDTKFKNLAGIGIKDLVGLPRENQEPVIQDGERIPGEDAFNFQEIARSAVGLMQRVDQTVGKLNEAVTRIDQLLLSEDTLTNLSTAVLNFRMLADRSDPTIVCAQLGEVNTGAFDPIGRIVDIVRAHPNAWLHVDGAFGLWAAASPRLRTLLAGHDGADSWATDAHKWLNVPYDCGLIFARDAAAHRAAMGAAAAYLPPAPGQERDPFEWVPELSRRGRGFTVYAAIRELGSDGIAAMVERCCDLASRMARRLANGPGVRIHNEVVLNQVLVSFGGDDGLTRDVIRRVQGDGTAWLGGTTFHGIAAMRISVSEWTTQEKDADQSVDAIVRCLEDARAGRAVD